MPLYHHIKHPHEPTNPIDVQQKEQEHLNLYQRFNNGAALFLSKVFSSMELFWFTSLFCLFWLLFNSIGHWAHFDPPPFPLLLMIWNIPQLPLLPLLAIAAALLGRQAARQAIEMYNNIVRLLHEFNEAKNHLNAQDEFLVEYRRDTTNHLSAQDEELRQHRSILHQLASGAGLAIASTPPDDNQLTLAISPATHRDERGR